MADNCIALFSRFFPCGVWEAVYIVDGLLQQQSKAEPKEIHADTQGQSFPFFGLAYLSGFDLLPRIRNFKDRVFFRPGPEVTYTHIDALFGEPISWKLIERNAARSSAPGRRTSGFVTMQCINSSGGGHARRRRGRDTGGQGGQPAGPGLGGRPLRIHRGADPAGRPRRR